MTVRIVTDSLSDLTIDLIGKLDITLVPLTVLFGHEKFLDRVTVSTDEFYHRLIYGDIWPTSAQTSPQEFANTCDKLAGEEADKLTYNIIAAALSLAQDGIPAALAAYDDQGVILTTPSLAAQALTIRTLEIVGKIVTKENATKSLNPPDVGRLQANIRRLAQAENQPVGVLRELLQIEFKSLRHSARSSPCTAALNEVMAKTNQQSTVLIISNQNHDAEALAFNLHALAIKGNTIIAV